MKYLITIIILLMIAGCSNNTAKEKLNIKLTKLDGTKIELEYRPELAQWSLLSITGTKNVEHETLLSRTSVGQLYTQSDPNSIQATGSLLGEVLKAVVK